MKRTIKFGELNLSEFRVYGVVKMDDENKYKFYWEFIDKIPASRSYPFLFELNTSDIQALIDYKDRCLKDI